MKDFACICFGQTGSGKTHTLFGAKTATSAAEPSSSTTTCRANNNCGAADSSDGVCLLTARYLLDECGASMYTLFASFYEIYNGQLYDLSTNNKSGNNNNKLAVREDASGKVNVVGLCEHTVEDIGDLRRLIELAQSRRHIGSTSFNKSSSRSHAVVQFRVKLNQQPRSNTVAARSNTVVKSKTDSGLNANNEAPTMRLLFIDLAGSERSIDAQHNAGDNRKEVAEINQSLLAVCISSPLIRLEPHLLDWNGNCRIYKITILP